MRVLIMAVTIAGVAGAALAGFAVARSLADPRPVISPMVVPGLSAPAPTVTVPTGDGPAVGGTTLPGRAAAQQVPGLQQLVGTLRAGDDPGEWFVSGVEVGFGPAAWLATAGPLDDYDGDGRRESPLEELRGLQGRRVTLGVRFDLDDDLDEAVAFVVEGRPFRDPSGGPAPWQVRPAGAEATREQVLAAALAAAGAGAVPLDMDRDSTDGWTRWEVDVLSPDGREYEVAVDIAGVVLDIRPEDDGGMFHRAAAALGELVS